MNETERKNLEKDIVEMISKRLNNKKFLMCISFHTGGNAEQINASSFICGNIDFSKDPFNLVKTVIAGLQGAIGQFSQKIMGVSASEGNPAKETGYHQ
jgi:hypothetical protein